MLVAAAIAPNGSCGRLLTAAINERWQLVASQQLLDELEAVLRRNKFRRWLTESEVSRFIAGIGTLAEIVIDPPPVQRQATRDPKDEFLVVLAQTADVSALVSGDPHLTELVDLTPPVYAPAAFLKELEASDW